MKKANVLVTGSHRSGTTWLAKVLASSSLIHYIPEPFNLSFNHPANPFEHWFQYIDKDSDEISYEKYISRFLDFTWQGAIMDLRKIKSKSLLKSYLVDQYERISKPVNLMKDPIAIMSSEWLAQKFNMKVIVIVRHPAAFVSSIKLKNWNFHFGALLNQKHLIDDHFPEFKKQIEKYSFNSPDVVDQAILLWNLIYFRVKKLKENNHNWLFITHEDLSTSPYMEIEKIAQYINIPFDENISKAIHETTSSEINRNSIEESLKDSIRRNSSENISSWKNRLSEEEIEKVKIETKSVWKHYYTEEDW